MSANLEKNTPAVDILSPIFSVTVQNVTRIGSNQTGKVIFNLNHTYLPNASLSTSHKSWKIMFTSLLSKTFEIKIYKNVILPAVFVWV